jgi:hypothetical protein
MMKPAIKVLFASGSQDLIPIAIEQMQKLLPELPLVVVSEFPFAGVNWIPYRSRAACGKTWRFSAGIFATSASISPR